MTSRQWQLAKHARQGMWFTQSLWLECDMLHWCMHTIGYYRILHIYIYIIVHLPSEVQFMSYQWQMNFCQVHQVAWRSRVCRGSWKGSGVATVDLIRFLSPKVCWFHGILWLLDSLKVQLEMMAHPQIDMFGEEKLIRSEQTVPKLNKVGSDVLSHTCLIMISSEDIHPWSC